MEEVIVYPVCHSYWRLIKAGRKTYEAVLDKYKTGVKYLAQQDVNDGVITAAEYKDYIGEDFQAS